MVALTASHRTAPAVLMPRTLAVWGIRLLLIVVILALWQLAGLVDPFLGEALSTPLAVLTTLVGWTITGPVYVYPEVFATLAATAGGLAIGILGAVALVAVMGAVPFVARACAWLVAAANAVPKVALIPLLILWFGVGPVSKLIFVASVVGFLIFYNLYNGLLAIDRRLYDNVRVLGASRRWQVLQVTVPALTGWFAAGLRASAAYALLSTVVIEYLGSNSGLGRLIATSHASLQSDEVIAGVIVVGLVAMGIDRLIIVVERRMRPWRAE